MTGVLHVVWEYPPVIYGGLARHAEDLARAQQQAGWQVSVITPAEDVTQPGRRVPAGLRVRRDVQVLRVRRPLPRVPWSDLLGAAHQLDDTLADAALLHLGTPGTPRPAVVHAHDWIGARAARTVADRLGVPLVLTVHATEFGRRLGGIGPELDGGTPAAVHALERLAVAAADVVLVCSEAMRSEVCTVLDADPRRVRLTPNAVDAATWRAGPAAIRAARRHWLAPGPGRPQPPGSADPTATGPLIAAVGRIEWEKGFSTVIRALPELRRDHPQIRLVLAGRGSYTPTLVALARELGVADLLTMPGWLARRDLAALYAAADMVVVPSRYEPSGLVAREAQAAGATVVSTRTGGLVEAVQDGFTGVLFDIGDVHALRDTISLLIAQPAMARQLARAGAAAVRALTWADVADLTGRAYLAAELNRPSSAPKQIAQAAAKAMIGP
jgi:glycogen(starch) synthase